MTIFARIIGIPGAGKTTRGIDIVKKIHSLGIPLTRIGYSTFTRAGRKEASTKAAAAFGFSIDKLEREGFFRTLHSCCMRCIGFSKGELVNGDRDWFKNTLGELVETESNDDGEWDGQQFKGENPVVHALRLWDIARSRLMSLTDLLNEMHDQLRGSRRALYDLNKIDPGWIESYEAVKQKDNRFDFTDYIARYAGLSFSVGAEPRSVDPVGVLPDLPAWLLDEFQDTTPLLNIACKRLITGARWVYLLGDPLQSVYSFCGADPEMLMSYPVKPELEEYLTKSWRCSQAILDIGSQLIFRNCNYTKHLASLTLEPARPGGKVTVESDRDWCHDMDPAVDTLVMARSNYEAGRMGNQLCAARIPWISAKGGKRFPSIVHGELCQALLDLEAHKPITGRAWARVVAAVPVSWLIKGAKTRWAKADTKKEAKEVKLNELTAPFVGGTPGLIDEIESGDWRTSELLGTIRHDIATTLAVRQVHGALADHPKVRLSTIHGSKGMEAERVYLHTGLPRISQRSMFENEDISEEERRVWYVGMTRARNNLTFVKSSRNYNYQDIYDLV